ncbi:MAG: helix-turn-helix domain-containing protein [Planctomycetota bacterium]
MAKMFYTLEEAAGRLGKSVDEVRSMIESGELQEFRSGDDLVVKREQIDLIVGDDGSDDSAVSEILGSGESAVSLVDDSINEDSLGVIGLSDSVVDDDSPIVDAGVDDSLVIGLEESSIAGGLDDDPSEGVPLNDEPEPEGADGSVALTDSVTDMLSSTGETTAGSTGNSSATGSGAGSASHSASGIALAPTDGAAGADESGAGGSPGGSGAPADASRGGSGVISLANESGMDLASGDLAAAGLSGSDISGIGSGAGMSGAGMSGAGLSESGDSKEQTGISIFDDGLDDDDAMGATIVTTDATAPDMTAQDFDSGASGSGLLDLTREGDDTSLGVDLLGGGEDAGGSAAGVAAVSEEGVLFETPEASESDLAAAAPAMMLAEPYDGGGSGLVGGLALGVVLAALFTGSLAIIWLGGGSGALLFEQIGGLPWFAPVAGIGGLTLLVTLVAWALGRRG